jgi:hypothetical protein
VDILRTRVREAIVILNCRGDDLLIIQVGDQKIDWKEFKSCKDTKKVVLIEGDVRKVIGTTTEEVNVFEKDNILRRVQVLDLKDEYQGSSKKTTIDIELSTFKPIITLDSDIIECTYNDLEIIRKYRDGSKEEGNRIMLKSKCFDLYSVELILRLLPLTEELEVILPVYDVRNNKQIDTKIKVIHKENIFNGLETVEAWKVDTLFGENKQTYWIDGQSFELLKQSVEITENLICDFVR